MCYDFVKKYGLNDTIIKEAIQYEGLFLGWVLVQSKDIYRVVSEKRWQSYLKLKVEVAFSYPYFINHIIEIPTEMAITYYLRLTYFLVGLAPVPPM